MDPRLIQFRAEFLALETLIVGLLRGVIATNPDVGASLRQKETQFAEKLRLHTLPGMSPEESDALSAEVQEAWEQLMQRVLAPKD